MDIEAISLEFQNKERTFKHLEQESTYVIRKALERTDIKLHSITSRVKKLPSFLDKCRRLEPKDPLDDIPIANMPLEIQIRTVAMDAWANVSHHLQYKREIDIPSDLRRDFYGLSGLFYVADKHFEMFFRSRDESREQLAEAFSKTTDSKQEINLDSLTAYLQNKFPKREHDNAKDVSGLMAS